MDTIRIHDSLASAKPAWDALAALPTAHAFQNFRWLSLWLETIGRDLQAEPCVAEVSDEAGPAMLLPLCLTRRGRATHLEFMGSPVCDYNAPLVRPDLTGPDVPDALTGGFRPLWRRILAALPRHDMVFLRKLPALLADGSPNPMLGLPTWPHAFSAYAVTLGLPWREFRMSRFSGSHRRKLNNQRNRLGRTGRLEFTAPDEPDAARDLARLTLDIKGRWLEDKGLENVFARPSRREFHLRAASELPDLVRTAALSLDGTPISTHYGLVGPDRMYGLILALRPGPWLKASPSVLLLEDMTRWCIEQGLSVFDLSIGGLELKSGWADQVRPMVRHVAARTLRGAPTWAGTALKGLVLKSRSAADKKN